MPSICCRESLYVGESRVAPGEGCRLRSATIAIWSCQATIENARQCCIGPVRWPIAVGQRGWRPARVEEFRRVVNGQTCANRDTPAARRDERLGGRQGLVRWVDGQVQKLRDASKWYTSARRGMPFRCMRRPGGMATSGPVETMEEALPTVLYSCKAVPSVRGPRRAST